jgi:integrase
VRVEHLTKTVIEQLKPSAKRYAVTDGKPAGFRVVVHPTGRKVFELWYRTRARVARTINIGKFPTLSLAEAREIANRHWSEIFLGNDPAKARADQKIATTIDDLATKFLKGHVETHLKPKSKKQYERLISKLKLKFGKIKVRDLSRRDIKEWHNDGHSTPRESNFALAVLSKMMSYAVVDLEWRSENPCIGIKRYHENRRERFLSDVEYARLGEVLRAEEAGGTASKAEVAAIRLFALTGCRRNEILTLKWGYVDFRSSCLRLPDSKTGPKVVPLGAPALEILASMQVGDDDDLVFPGSIEGSVLSLYGPWHRIREKAGLKDVRLHDLRHGFASVGAMGGASLPIIGKVLGHNHPQTTARYAHLSDDPVQAAAGRIANQIDAAMSGSSARVVPIKNTK